MSLDRGLLESWMAGCRPGPARFELDEPVVVLTGPFAGILGVIVSLVALDPEPVYTVKLGAGARDVHLSESALESA